VPIPKSSFKFQCSASRPIREARGNVMRTIVPRSEGEARREACTLPI